MQETSLKKDWTLNREAFHRLLDWLDEGTNSEGQTYLEMRRRLVAYFDRKNCFVPDELADETLTRVARRLEEESAIESETPAKYCYTMARFVFLEHLRVRASEQRFRNEGRAESRSGPENLDRREKEERMLACLERCAGKLDSRNRELILRYYNGKQKTKIENRRVQAGELGLTANALAIRACRIRDQLEHCVRECLTHHETIS